MPERRRILWWEGLRYLAGTHRWDPAVVEALSRLCTGQAKAEPEKEQKQ